MVMIELPFVLQVIKAKMKNKPNITKSFLCLLLPIGYDPEGVKPK
jgi:hypothetical protein